MNGCMQAAGFGGAQPPPPAYPAPNNAVPVAPPAAAPGAAAPGLTEPARSMRIIGITGTIGAGKGTVVEYLTKPPHNFVHYSARTLLNKIIAERGLPEGRDSLRMVANELREARGPAAVIEALYGFPPTLALLSPAPLPLLPLLPHCPTASAAPLPYCLCCPTSYCLCCPTCSAILQLTAWRLSFSAPPVCSPALRRRPDVAPACRDGGACWPRCDYRECQDRRRS